jgi:biotin carboxylase
LFWAAFCLHAVWDQLKPGETSSLFINAKFAQICADHGVKFIGPTPDMINAMGDKITAKETMIKAGVPVVPGSGGLLESVEQAKELAAKVVGYPVILKATAGGGGKGMRVVWEESELEKAFENAKTEAAASFKNDGIYMEKFVEEPRHIEIQIAGDQFGNVCHLSERDCSIQRRHQKLVEESDCLLMFGAMLTDFSLVLERVGGVFTGAVHVLPLSIDLYNTLSTITSPIETLVFKSVVWKLPPTVNVLNHACP